MAGSKFLDVLFSAGLKKSPAWQRFNPVPLGGDRQ
jgi:hypothetical protein